MFLEIQSVFGWASLIVGEFVMLGISSDIITNMIKIGGIINKLDIFLFLVYLFIFNKITTYFVSGQLGNFSKL